MKKILLLSFITFFVFRSFAQDSTDKKWQPTVSMAFGPVSVYNISGVDTSFVNSLSISPAFTIRNNKTGIGLIYSPSIVTGGPKPGIYMHTITFGVEQYDKKVFDYTFNYSHYFFTNNGSIPYSPLNNEIDGSFTYKKPWLRPSFSAGIGFGNNTETIPASSAYDIAASAGVGHSFSWEKNKASYTLAPSFSLNAGTNEYFSLLNITKYVGRNKKSAQISKNNNAARGRRNNGGGGSTTTTTTVSGETFNLNNLELGMEGSVEIGSFTVRSTGNIYFPIGSLAGTGTVGYWDLTLSYNF